MALLGAGALAPLNACTSSPPPSPRSTGLPDKFHYMGLQEIGRLIASREVSPVDLTQRMLDRITTVDATLKSYATLMADQAMAAARTAEQEIQSGKYRGPLHGVPVAVKDLCYTKGVRTMGGTPVFRDFVPEVDATVVSRLRNAGAVVLGKLNLTEGAFGGYHPDFDIPLNPWDRSRWPGVSSSGSGVATAAGLCFGAIGTDTGGFIRFPSSANGIVGLKPTYGRVSRFGVIALAESLDHVGPMARRVADVALMFDAVAGHDPKDPTSLVVLAPNTVDEIGQGVQGLRIGIDRAYALAGIDSGQVGSIEDALKVLGGLGAQIVEVHMPASPPCSTPGSPSAHRKPSPRTRRISRRTRAPLARSSGRCSRWEQPSRRPNWRLPRRREPSSPRRSPPCWIPSMPWHVRPAGRRRGQSRGRSTSARWPRTTPPGEPRYPEASNSPRR